MVLYICFQFLCSNAILICNLFLVSNKVQSRVGNCRIFKKNLHTYRHKIFPQGAGWVFPYRYFIGRLSGGFLVIIAKKGSSKIPQGPSPPLLLTVVVDFVTLLTCCNKSLFVILIHCVTVATVTTPTKTKRKRRRTNKNCFLEFQRLTNGTNPWEKFKRKETK